MTRLVRLLLLVLGLGVIACLVWHAGVRIVIGMLLHCSPRRSVFQPLPD